MRMVGSVVAVAVGAGAAAVPAPGDALAVTRSGSSKNPPPEGVPAPGPSARTGRVVRRSPKLPSVVGRVSAWMERVLSVARACRSPNRSKGRLAARPAEATARTFGRAPNT